MSMSQCFSDDKEMILYLNKARLAVDRDKPVNSEFGNLDFGTSFIDNSEITQVYQL